AAAVGAVAEGRAGGVAVLDDDVVVGYAQRVGHDLREGRLQALAVRQRAASDDDLAGQVDPHVRAFPQPGPPALARQADPGARRDAADLDVAADAQAQVAALFARLGLLFAEVLIIDHRERAVERRLVVAAVVGQHAQPV